MTDKDAMLAAVEIAKAAVEKSNGDVLSRTDEVVSFIEAVYGKVRELTDKGGGARIA